mgnify:CR=1 FL=1
MDADSIRASRQREQQLLEDLLNDSSLLTVPAQDAKRPSQSRSSRSPVSHSREAQLNAENASTCIEQRVMPSVLHAELRARVNELSADVRAIQVKRKRRICTKSHFCAELSR